MKRYAVLVITIVLLMLCTTAMADNTRTSGLYTYEIKGNGTITITGFNWNENGENDVFVPSMIDGYTVTKIADEAFKYDDKSYNPNYKLSVTLPATITSIGEKAFWHSEIASINIPESVNYVGYGAFVGCGCQVNVASTNTVYASIDGSLYHKQRKELLHYYGTYDSHPDVPEGILSIGDYAFAGRWVYRDFRNGKWNCFPSTLTHIGNYAFYKTTFHSDLGKGYISELRIPEAVQSIGDYAFAEAQFGYNRYSKTGETATIVLPSTLASLGVGTFYVTEYKEYVAIKFRRNEILTEIPNDCFYRCKKVDAKETQIKAIGEAAFQVVQEIELPDSVVKISKCSFVGAYGKGTYGAIKNVIIPQGVTTIPEEAYRGIGGSDGIGTLDLANVTRIESKAFENVNDKNVYLSPQIEWIAEDAFGKLSTFTVESGSYAEMWCNENGFGYSVNNPNSLDWLNN